MAVAPDMVMRMDVGGGWRSWRLGTSILVTLAAATVALALLVLPGAPQALGAAVMLTGLGFGGSALVLLGAAEYTGRSPSPRHVLRVGAIQSAVLVGAGGVLWAVAG